MTGSGMCGYCAQSCGGHVFTIRPGQTPYCSYGCALSDYTHQLRHGLRRWWDGATIVDHHQPPRATTVLTEVLGEKKALMRQLQGECQVIQRSIDFLQWCQTDVDETAKPVMRGRRDDGGPR